MTRIDFYIIKEDSASSREQLACRLAEKAYQQGHKIYVHTQDKSQTTHIDELLWTFRQGSFLPHETYQPDTASHPPIVIGHDADPEHHHDVLINLGSSIPIFFSRFERVVEIVPPDEQAKNDARERFGFYRDRGYSLKSHQLSI